MPFNISFTSDDSAKFSKMYSLVKYLGGGANFCTGIFLSTNDNSPIDSECDNMYGFS